MGLFDMIAGVYDTALNDVAWASAQTQIAKYFDGYAACLKQISFAGEPCVTNLAANNSNEVSVVVNHLDRYLADSRFLANLKLCSLNNAFLAKDAFDLNIESQIVFREFGNTLFIPLSRSLQELETLIVFRPSHATTLSGKQEKAAEVIQHHMGRILTFHHSSNDASTLIPLYETLLNRLNFPIFLVDRDLSIKFSNDAGNRMLERKELVEKDKGRIKLRQTSDHETLIGAVEQVLCRKMDGPFSIFEDEGSNDIFALEVLALEARDVASNLTSVPTNLALIYLKKIGDPNLPFTDSQRLCLKFTRTEWTIATALANGKSTQEIADEQGSTPQTVRWHIKQIFAKTKTRRQAELVRFLVDIQMPVM